MLKTVRVPPYMEKPFAAAEELVARYFAERRDDPATGTIEIHGERYVLVRAAALSVEFFALVSQLYGEGHEAEADEFARNILFDLAHAIGRSDAKNFHARTGLADPIERLSAGPVHFAYTGWASVDIDPASRPTPGLDFYLLYDHPYAFESDAWLRAGQRRRSPACIMNAGYSSGWCEESFGVSLVASEILCRAKGDDVCRFIMAHPDRIEGFVARYAEADEETAARVRGHAIPDFFQRKRAEEELHRARDDLRQRQAHKLEALGQLAGGIAHDFNNLMSVVIGRSALLLRALPEGDPQREGLLAIRESGERAAQLTRQLLAFGRAQLVAHEPIDLHDVIKGVSRILEALIGERVALTVELDQAAPVVLGDRGNLEQIVLNLAVNARDAMPDGGTLRIATRRASAPARGVDVKPGRYAVMEVRDDGIGMDAATRARIFDPYFTTKATGQGTGLGLSTVYGIVRQSGGDIVVESAPRGGSTFSVWLPLTDAIAPAVKTTRTFPPARSGGARVLLIEDQPEVRRTTLRMLTELGYDAIDASSPEEAIERAESDPRAIDVLLTDVVMPRIGGRETAERVRKLRPAVRVLFMSGYVDDEGLRGAVAEGATLLAKPFTPEELERALRKCGEALASRSARDLSARWPRRAGRNTPGAPRERRCSPSSSRSPC